MKDALSNWMITSNLVLMSVIPTLTLLSLSHQVTAKDSSICYMVTSSGKTINLANICGVTIPKQENVQNRNKSIVSPSHQKTVQTRKKSIISPPHQEIAQVPPKSRVSQPNFARIPIKRHLGRTPVIEVTFNHKQKFEMILDTGANSTLITRKMAKLLKIKSTGSVIAQVADGSEVNLPSGNVKSIAVGRIVSHNLPVAIAPKEW